MNVPTFTLQTLSNKPNFYKMQLLDDSMDRLTFNY